MRSLSRFNHRNTARWPTVLFTFLAVTAVWCLPALAKGPGGLPEILVQTGHSMSVESSHFSPDGTRLLTGGRDGLVILWDVATGRKLRVFKHTTIVEDVVFSADGARVLTCSWNRKAVLWDVTTGEKLRTFEASAECAAVHRDGRRFALGRLYDAPVIYDLETGESLLTLTGHEGGSVSRTVVSVAFSRDGSKLLTSAHDNTARLWDADSGELLRTYRCESTNVNDAVFSPDDRFVLTAGGHNKWRGEGPLTEMILWDATSGEQVHHFAGHTAEVNSVAFSDDGRFIASGSDDGTLIVWDAHQFEEKWSFTPNGHSVGTVAFSPDSQTLVAAAADQITLYDAQSGQIQREPANSRMRGAAAIELSRDGRRLYTSTSEYACVVWDMENGRSLDAFGHQTTDGMTHIAINEAHGLALFATRDHVVTLWDLKEDRPLHRFKGHTNKIRGVALSADGRLAATFSLDKSVAVWDTATGRRLRTLEGHESSVWSLAFSPDSNYLLTGLLDGAIGVWNVQTGQMLRKLEGQDSVNCIAFSDDGRLLATGSQSMLLVATTVIWDWKSGRQLHTLRGHASRVDALAFSPDGSRLLTGAWDSKVLLWDTRTGDLLRTMEGHTSGVMSVAFRNDGGMALSSGRDGTMRMWDLATGKQLVRLINLDEGPDWLAITPEGLFDGSKGGREKVSFRVGEGLKVVPVDRFFQDFYHPGLLAAIWNRERPLPEIELSGDAPPSLRIVSPSRGASDARDVTIQVEAVDAGSGISRWALYQNGARVLAPGESRPKGKATVRTFRVSLVEGENRFRITAANADGSWEAEPVRLLLSYQRPLSKPELYVVAVGINRYAQETMNLKFAVSDAKAVAGLFRNRGASLYAKVNVTELTDDQATRAGIQKALKAVAAKAQPQDTLLVFFAGHGTMVQQRYYFVPHEFAAKAGSLEDNIRKQALPVDELGDWLAAVPSLKRMLIFDTCQSGGVLGLSKGARNPFALRGAIERLSRAQGVFTIAAAASTADAQEIPELKHGALTYALLAGLGAIDEGPLADTKIRTNDPDEVVDVLRWFSFASGQVPRLTADLLGAAQDVQTSGEGTSFPVLPIVQ